MAPDTRRPETRACRCKPHVRLRRRCGCRSAMSACAIPTIRTAISCRARARRNWSSRRTSTNTISILEPIVTPKLRQYFERVIHGEIYKARPDVMAVCHHHSPSISELLHHRREARCRSITSASVIGHEVPFWDQRDEFGDTNLLVRLPEEGASLARALGQKQHGADAPPRRNRRRQKCARPCVPHDLFLPQCRVSDPGEDRRQGLTALTPGEIDMAGKIHEQPNAVCRARGNTGGMRPRASRRHAARESRARAGEEENQRPRENRSTKGVRR